MGTASKSSLPFVGCIASVGMLVDGKHGEASRSHKHWLADYQTKFKAGSPSVLGIPYCHIYHTKKSLSLDSI